MDPQALERLMIDRSLGLLDADSESLLEEFLAQDPQAARTQQQYAQAAQLARVALGPAQPPAELPPLRLAKSRILPRRWGTRVAAASAVAASLLLGLGAGAVLFHRPAAPGPTPVASRWVEPPAPPAAVPQRPALWQASQNDNPGQFWSARRLHAQAAAGAAGQAPVARWTSPAHEPGKG